MPTIEKRSISLPTKRDEAVERWLKDEVAPAYDAMAADSSRGIPAESVFAEIRTRHTMRLRDPK